MYILLICDGHITFMCCGETLIKKLFNKISFDYAQNEIHSGLFGIYSKLLDVFCQQTIVCSLISKSLTLNKKELFKSTEVAVK